MNRILIGLVVFTYGLLIAYVIQSNPAEIPNAIIANDLIKTTITWEWTRAKGTNNAAGFRIYCGDVNNNSSDGTTEYYTEMEQVSSNTARSYLVWPMVQALAGREGSPTSSYSIALNFRCRVVAYNSLGESEDSISGVPSKPKNIKFVSLP